ncbi:DMT family transporter [Natrinema sp. 1APR25-10V2]|uniref:DMT family transporter n=1 Tax=Natrinema sp. 1APR25-10V2 TaxID=2951081 RepID=UPI0028750A24|nr:DMT family transporter [Natrinema sp. 1APR25-10V2]MDS0477331.1 DMT family transporter [Natrinema sp. 1APR25-10V2]
MIDIPIQILLALGTAFAFATSSVLTRFGVERSAPIAALFVTVTVNAIVLWTVSIMLYDVTINLWAWRYFLLAGVFAPVIGRLCNYIGLKRVGVNLTLPISNSNPLVSIMLAMLLLNETLSPRGQVGALAVITGGILLASANRNDNGAVAIRYSDLLFPVAGAVIYGSVQLLRKAGMGLVPSPAVGAAVNLTASWFVIAAFLTVVPSQRDRLSIPREDLQYFVLAGIASSFGLICLYAALLSGTVVIVTPLLNTTPLFALALTYIFLRDREPFTLQVIAGTTLIVTGVGLLVMSS